MTKLQQNRSPMLPKPPKNTNQQVYLNFDCKKILQLWLAQILPAPKVQFRYEERKGFYVVGERLDCQHVVSNCQKEIQQRKMKLVKDMVLEPNQEMYLKIKLNLKIYYKSKIENTSSTLINKYGVFQLKKQVEAILKKNNVYLISILGKDDKEFQKQMAFVQSRPITRADISEARMIMYGPEEEEDVQTRRRGNRQRGRCSNNATRLRNEKPRKTYTPKVPQVKQQKQQIPEVQQQTESEPEEVIEDDEDEVDETIITISDLTLEEQNIKENSKEKQEQNDNGSDDDDSRILKELGEVIKEYPKKKKLPPRKSSQDEKQIFFNQTFKTNYLNENRFLNWIEMNKPLQISECTFDKTNDMTTVKFATSEQKQKHKKISKLNYYFFYTRFIHIKDQNFKLTNQMKSLLKQLNEDYAPCELKEGYVKENATQDQITEMIKDKKIQFKQSQQKNKKVRFIMIKGIKPNVDQCEREIRQLIKDNEEKPFRNEKIAFQLKNLEPYLDNKKVVEMISQVLEAKLKKYPYIRMAKVLNRTQVCPQFIVEFEVQSYDVEELKMKAVPQLQEHIVNELHCEEAMEVDDLTDELSNKYLLLQSKADKTKLVLIESKDKAITATKDIGQCILKRKFETKTISFKRNQLKMLRQFVKEQESINSNNAKFRFIENENKMQIIGFRKFIKRAAQKTEQYLNQLESQILEMTFNVSHVEAGALEKHADKFQKALQDEFNLSYHLTRNLKIGAVVSVGPSQEVNMSHPLVFYIQKQRVLTCLHPFTWLVFLSKRDLNFLHDKVFANEKAALLQGSRFCENKELNYRFSFLEGENNLQRSIEYCMQNPYPQFNFAFFMPAEEKSSFVENVANLLYLRLKEAKWIRACIFDSAEEDIQKNLMPLQKIQKQCLQKTKEIYFITKPTLQKMHRHARKVQYYYNESGNKKIRLALQKGEKKVYLQNQDLDVSEATHLCSFKHEKLVHISTQKETDIFIYPDRVTFKIDGIEFYMPPSQVKKVEKEMDDSQWVKVSIGVYEIDLENMIQKNLFSGYCRNLKKKQVESNNPYGGWFFNVDFTHQANEVEICYRFNEEKLANAASHKLRELIEQAQIRKIHTTSYIITKQKFQKIKQQAKEHNLQIQWIGKKEIQIKGFQKKEIELFAKGLEIMFLSETSKVKYPETWVDQKQDIEVHEVASGSQEFLEVYNQFKIGPIKQLLRIQNKLVYKKYYEEREDLIKLNEGAPVKEMMLFHGTRDTDPKQIYLDKQECFNVNYTGQRNYLGRGSYFAEEAKYSHTYRHKQNVFGGQRIYSMLLCTVLVGQSEMFANATLQTQEIIDTNFKNPDKKIRYESNKMFTNNSYIYAVYKNRRAYPCYLIKY